MSLRLIATGSSQELDVGEARRFLAAVADPAHGCLIFALPGARAATCAGTDLDGLVDAARKYADDSTGIYYGLNPIPVNHQGAAKDEHVLCRRWLLVDIDGPNRFGEDARGKKFKQGATDREKATCLQTIQRIRDHLTGLGWPAPVVVDSGNGWHHLYRCDLPNDEASKELVQSWLKRLALRFDGNGCHVDTGVHPAKQIAKLPGSWARRGQNTPDRPHRIARLVELPADLSGVVTPAMLRVVAETQAMPPATESAANGNGHAPSGLKVTAPPEGLAYARGAMEDELRRLGEAQLGHNLNTKANECAFILGKLCPPLDPASVFDALYAVMKQLGANCPRKDQDTLRRAIREGQQSPRDLSHLGTTPAPSQAPTEANQTEPTWGVFIGGSMVRAGSTADLDALGVVRKGALFQRYELLTLGALMETHYPEPQWAVAGLLAEGLNLLAGNPKSGKSMLALNLGLTVAGGGMALGSMKTVPGDVLYLSLEDQFRRVQFRARKMAPLMSGEVNRRLSICTRWPRVHKGGLALLREWVTRVTAPRLVIIDVLGKFRPPTTGRGNAYEQDSEHLYAIKEFADENGLTVLVLHHTRKQSGGKDAASDRDQFEDISGTQGLGGACDGLLMLRRARMSNDALVSVTGRDGGEQQLALLFDPATMTWTSQGSAEEHLKGLTQKKVVAYLKARSGAPVFVQEIADATDLSGDVVRKAMHRLLEKGIVQKRGNAWVYPAEVPPDSGGEWAEV